MQKLSLGILLIFLFGNLNAQSAESLSDFFEKVEQGQSAYFSYDTTGIIPMLRVKSDMLYYYEVLKTDSGEVFFMEESFFAQRTFGVRQVCKCTSEETKTYFQKQKKYWADARKGRFGFSMGDINFFENKCIQERIHIKPGGQSPKLQRLLDGDYRPANKFKEEIKVLDVSLNVDLLHAADGRWLLDLSGQLPENLTFIEFGDDHKLAFIKDDQHFHYPSVSTESWKTKLIQSGLFTSKIVGGAPNNNLMERNRYFPSRMKPADVDFNMLFSLYSEQETYDDSISTKGTIFLTCQDTNLKTEKQPLSMEAGSRVAISCDGRSLQMKDLKKEQSGRLVFGESIPWNTIKIFDADNQLIETYQNGTPGNSHVIEFEKEGVLSFELSTYTKVKVAIPFEEKVSTKNLNKNKTSISEQLIFQNFSLTSPLYRFEDKGLRAEYSFNLPANKYVQKVMLQSVKDDTGNDLLAGQAMFIDSINLEAEKASANKIYKKGIGVNLKNGIKWEKDRFNSTDKENKYEINLVAFGLPAKNAKAVFIEGTTMVIGADQEAYPVYWKDTLHLSKVAIAVKDHGARIEQTKTSNRPIRIDFHALESNPYLHGIGASIPFQANTDKGKIFSIDGKQSKLIYLKDDLGKDLVPRHFEQFEDRLAFVKTARTMYGSDDDFNKSQIIQGGNIFYWKSTFPDPILMIRTYAPISKPASKVYGKADLALLLYDPDQTTTSKISKKFRAESNMVLKEGEVLIPFRKSSFDQKDRNGKEYHSYSIDWPNNLAIHSIIAKDSAGAVINLQQADSNYPLASNAIYFPKDMNDVDLIFEINYSEVYSAKQEVEFEIGFNLKTK